MLERIKHLVDESRSSKVPFNQFYVQYMMEVQDQNMDIEVSNMFKRIAVEVGTLKQVDKMIDTEHRKLVK